jgi:N,N-dimethylformamidase
MDTTADTADELIGYSSAFSVEAGASIDFFVTATSVSYESCMVKLVHGDDNPAGPGFKEQILPGVARTSHPGRVQQARCGSFAISPPTETPARADSFTLHAWVQPTAAPSLRVGILTWWCETSSRGFGLFLEPEGDLSLHMAAGDGRPRICRTHEPVPAGIWSSVAGVYDGRTGSLHVRQVSRDFTSAPSTVRETASIRVPADTVLPVIIAGYSRGDDFPVGHFNGKIDRPAVLSQALDDEKLRLLEQGSAVTDVATTTILGAWDFSADPADPKIADISGNGLYLRTVNGPARAVTGFNWTGEEVDHRRIPHQYGAIHFHDDDLDDARWEVDFSWTIPDDTPSGVYAAKLSASSTGDRVPLVTEDHIPFVVRPRKGEPTADVLLVLPTFTYMAYANERLVFDSETVEALGAGATDYTVDPADAYLLKHPELGISMYDTHSDGSGSMYSSRLRPIPNVRPKYRFWCTDAPERFAADLYIVDWLEHIGQGYDVATDEDLHRDGLELLDSYRVVLTGTHPEYCTAAMISAVDAYLTHGGRLMYLGGNGFYWVTSVDERQPHVIELRRGVNGTRTWESAPGEGHHSTTGEPGGLWRYRGAAPNQLVGVGFAAQVGAPAPAAGYVRCPDSKQEAVRFIFEGVPDGEIIGDFGLDGGGAAGYEIDRIDYTRGTPARAMRLATSEGRHDPGYLLVVEDLHYTEASLGGDSNPLVRSDLVYMDYPRGGAVFSVGSCTWCASLSHNNYSNNVARISTNVLREFVVVGAAGERAGDRDVA